MISLFKEVISGKDAHKAEVEQPKEATAEQYVHASESVTKDTEKKGKHGDPGVCCGGCS